MTIRKNNILVGLVVLALLALGVALLVRHNRAAAPVTASVAVPQKTLPPVVVSPTAAPPSARVTTPSNSVAVRPVMSPDTSTLSPALQTLIGITPDATYAKRQAALRTLTKHLTADESAILLAFLEIHFADYQGLKPIRLNAIKNDILDVLLRQDRPITNLGSRMVAMFRDPAQDDTWHDYCIQYLAPYYSATWAPPPQVANAAPGVAPAPELDPERQEIAKTYWDAVAQSDKGIAGTALVGLETLSRQYPEFDRERVGGVAATLANDEQTCEATRITALRLCGMLKRPEALETARSLARNGAAMPLRMAAIATLGDLGGQQDLEYLRTAGTNEAPRLGLVIEAAVKKVHARLGLDKG